MFLIILRNNILKKIKIKIKIRTKIKQFQC